MKNLFIDDHKGYIAAIKMNNGVLEDFFALPKDNIVDNIYIGRVENVRGKQCFVNFDEKRKNGILSVKSNNYKSGDYIRCQVKRGEFEEKGAILTDEITLAGQYAILADGIKGYKFSHRLSKENKEKYIGNLPETKDYGFIIRKQSSGVAIETLVDEINMLSNDYNRLIKENINKIQCVYKKSLIDIIINQTEAYDCSITTNSQECLSDYKNDFSVYDGWQPIQDFYGLREQVESIFDRKVLLKNGAEIVFDETEAMTVVDVNAKGYLADIDLINKTAAQEILRQIKLRNICGMIMIDFITDKHNDELTSYINDMLKKDKEKAHAIGLNEYSIIAINRKKRYNTFKSLLYESCDKCAGRGLCPKTEYVCQRICQAVLNLYAETEFNSLLVSVDEKLYEEFLSSARYYLKMLCRRAKVYVKSNAAKDMYNLLITDNNEQLNGAYLIEEAK